MPIKESKPNLKVAYIMDEFSAMCWTPEFAGVPLNKDNYNITFQKNPDIDMVLVESAWCGNRNQWRLVVGPKNRWVGSSIDNILRQCRRRGIPSVFWNKEDPPHFKHFLPVARKFDYIFTTDKNCINKYRREAGCKRVYCLPFAAQPNLHKIASLSSRNNKPCFAGMFWKSQYPGRKRDMGHILTPAIKFGLDVYDRSRVGGAGNAFPVEYGKCVRGGVPYKQMVELYRKYRLFMNVNAVSNSPTMFSRRVFEIIACGTPLISANFAGNKYIGGSALISNSAADTVRYLESLLSDDKCWNEVSLKGIKSIYSAHTYAHRFSAVCNILNIPIPKNVYARVGCAEKIGGASSVDEAETLHSTYFGG